MVLLILSILCVHAKLKLKLLNNSFLLHFQFYSTHIKKALHYLNNNCLINCLFQGIVAISHFFLVFLFALVEGCLNCLPCALL